MSSDRAKVSYDASRQYRSVVAQQGRVTLEADINEAQQIAAENLRAETEEIVGRCGTPDNGYQVVLGSPPAFSAGAGTMYVGGLRVAQAAPVQYADQPEWLDHDADPLWVDPAGADVRGSEYVYLLLREQEVSAVEDVPLGEVALGGPDTAQRTRLIQRLVRMPVAANDCLSALPIAEKKWSALGVDFDEKTMQLASPARLKVLFVQQPVPESPCDPQVRGGYLGADNQLIRVQITNYDSATSTGRFVWGYNNASFLFRATAADTQSVDLKTAPIDSYHTPRANHPVEVLRSAVDLRADNFIAAHCGIIATPTQAYIPETRRLPLPAAALPANYVGTPSPLFLRLWEAEVTFKPGQAADLAGTGLQVVIDPPPGSGALTLGQFWMFAVRPSAPVSLYPQRYLDAPQPPEGPRMWACPLGVINWVQGKPTDCREKFDDLVTLTKRRSQCCSIVVTPADVGNGAGLQKLLDSLREQRATVSLQPGLYELPQPLVLDKSHSLLTLEGCRDGAVLAASAAGKDKFAQGLVILRDLSNFTLRRLQLELPLAAVSATTANAAIAIGVRAITCPDLHIEQCVFRFIVRPDITVRGAGIFAGGVCSNLRVERNRFLCEGQAAADKPPRTLIGIAAMPEIADPRSGALPQDFLAVALDNATIVGNEFAALTVAAFVRGEFGRLACENNFVHDCDGGFYFAQTDLGVTRAGLIEALQNRAAPGGEALFSALLHAAQPAVLATMHDLAVQATLPPETAFATTVRIGEPPDAARSESLRAEARLANAGLLAHFVAASLPVGTPTLVRPTPPDAIVISPEQIDRLTNSFLVAFPAAGDVAAPVPDLRLRGNDIAILPAASASVTPMVGLSVTVAAAATVMINANTIRGSSVQAIGSVMRPGTTVVTSNLILNSGGRTSFFISVDERAALMNVSGNAFRGIASINPPPAGAGNGAASWEILNSTRV